MRFAVFVLCFMFAPLIEVSAQDVRSSSIDSVRTLYQGLEYEEAERVAREALESDDPRAVRELAELHFMVGLVRFIRSDTLAARAEFESVLSLDEAFVPDPVLVSPRATAFFEQVRADSAARHRLTPGMIRYVMVQDMRPSVALRSAVLPGWGQWYRGDRTRGGVLTGAWIATGGTSVALAILDSDDANLTSVRTVTAVAAGAIWLYAYLDALITPAFETDGFRVAPVASPDAIGISAAWHF